MVATEGLVVTLFCVVVVVVETTGWVVGDVEVSFCEHPVKTILMVTKSVKIRVQILVMP